MYATKDAGIGYLLWLGVFLGFCGLHRFYMGKWVTGLLWLLTFGLFGIGQIIDLFLIPSMASRANRVVVPAGYVVVPAG